MPREQLETRLGIKTPVNEAKPHGEPPEDHHKEDKGSGCEDREREELVYSFKDNN